MRFVTIDATKRRVDVVAANRIDQVLKLVGLDPGHVDLTRACDGIGIMVWEFGLRADPETVKFFSLGDQVYAGNAVLFAYGEGGESIDLADKPPVMFYRSAREVEMAIQRDEIARPTVVINGNLVWAWPHPYEVNDD
jgi:hypothetical protein